MPVVLATVVVLATAVSGCTDDPDETAPTPDPTAAPSVPEDTRAAPSSEGLQRKPAAANVRVRNVWGRWPGPDSPKSRVLARQAGRSVTTWMRAAYVDVDYPLVPGNRVSGAFGTFTPGASRRARAQAGLLTGQGLGRDVVEVVPTRRWVQLIGYAPRGVAVGATASVQLVLLGRHDDGKRVETAVTGDLYLTRDDNNRWRVFGYELRRSSGAPGSYAKAQRR